MTDHREARDVVGALVDLLHKWGLRVDQSIRLKHTTNFRNNLLRVHHVLKDSLRHDCVEAHVSERQLVGIANDLRPGTHINIGLDELEVRTFDEVGHALSESTAADNEHACRRATCHYALCQMRESLVRADGSRWRGHKTIKEMPDIRMRGVYATGRIGKVRVEQTVLGVDEHRGTVDHPIVASLRRCEVPIRG